MNLSALRSSLRVMLPAVLLLASCSKKDEPTPTPVPATGSILFINAAANIFVGIKAFVNAEEKTSLTYGINGGGTTPQYQSVPAGSPTIRIDNAAANTPYFSQTVTVGKDQKYSYFVYSNSSDVNAAPVGLLVPDELGAPSVPTKAKIRLVNLAYGFPAGNSSAALSLSQSQPVGFLALTGAAGFAAATNFVEINSGAADLMVTTGVTPTGTTELHVGDGTGAGTGTKTFEAGKSYTIVVRGVVGNQDPVRQPKAFIIQNN